MNIGDIFRIHEPVQEPGYVISKDSDKFPIYGVCVDTDPVHVTSVMFIINDGTDIGEPTVDIGEYDSYYWSWKHEHLEDAEVIHA